MDSHPTGFRDKGQKLSAWVWHRSHSRDFVHQAFPITRAGRSVRLKRLHGHNSSRPSTSTIQAANVLYKLPGSSGGVRGHQEGFARARTFSVSFAGHVPHDAPLQSSQRDSSISCRGHCRVLCRRGRSPGLPRTRLNRPVPVEGLRAGQKLSTCLMLLGDAAHSLDFV